MKNITSLFSNRYIPRQAIVIHQDDKSEDHPFYAELFEFDEQGAPTAPHPLTVTEAKKIAKALTGGERDKQDSFIYCDGLLCQNVLYLVHHPEPTVIWHTPPQKATMLFSEWLSIPSGPASLPPLIWKATRKEIWVFAHKERSRPTLQTTLHFAPFFNIRHNGSVCMGDVDVTFSRETSLQQFISMWEKYFFGSYFSHMLMEESPTTGNIVELWQNLVTKDQVFPIDQLRPTSLTLQKIIP